MEMSPATLVLFSCRDAEKYEFNGNDLLSIEQLSAFAQESLEYILSQLADKLSDDKQLQSLKELENDLVSINTLIEKQIDSLLPGFTENYTNAFKNLGESANKKLGFYAGMANPNEKLRFGEQLKSCLEDTKSLITNLSLLPAKTQEIKAIYTDDISEPIYGYGHGGRSEKTPCGSLYGYTNTLFPSENIGFYRV
ncbi:hypothetical protein NYZ99_10145 [Maribacter litopenaei]|uniref:Uncharacterized protein n=1 Tax=Maribacter litopenaei TaxID=2976127 RepID=A0ABY5YCB9_9FLAO|nr:hypothetical protein [Maribacter litopenaei]UWX56508.1 hypothetical protein NYZ99_10145 [Maribacter litopenaei]